MNDRPRVFAAIINDDYILMVHIVNSTKDFWTLPGGGVESGETFEEAVVREVQEEVGLKVKVVQELFTNTYKGGIEKCFLVEMTDKKSIPRVGFDPELPIDQQVLNGVKWHSLKDVNDDIQVSKVIKALGFIVK